jgi:hypothetical protein
MKTASPRSTVPPFFRRRALPSPQAAVDRERIRSGQAGHQLLRQRDLRRKTYDLNHLVPRYKRSHRAGSVPSERYTLRSRVITPLVRRCG